MKTSLVILVLSAVVAAVVADGEYAPPAYEKKYDGYFQYANNPGPDEYEFGYNRGNAQHNRNHYEQSKDGRFRTKVKWADTYAGYGEHYWEYNHADAGYKAPVYDAPAYPAPAYSAPAYSAPAYSAPAYSAPAYSAPGYSENIPSFEPAPAAGKQ